MTPVSVIQGESPLVLGQPHNGTYVPPDIYDRLNDTGSQLLDTDWHVDKLYDGLLPAASIVRANFHRYVIDPNRAPDDISLYPGKNTTSLVPLFTFDNVPIWTESPTDADIGKRLETYHRAYHRALEKEIARIKQKFGVAILYDCHSIRSTIPHLFDGRLPDLNIGDNSGRACDPMITNTVANICARSDQFNHVVNGRFKGGWTTRHYGQPSDNVHAIQMELVQDRYLESEELPFAFAPEKAETLRALLKQVLTQLHEHALSGQFQDLTS
jgi:formiminoglutamase